MTDRETVRRAYDELARTYAAQRSDELPDAFSRLLAPLSADACVLDAGCGQGTPVLEALDDAATAVGVDFSREQLSLARAAVPTARLVHGDLTALPLVADAFDAVAAFHSLIHVPSDQHQTVIDEFARVLRPGGRVLLSTGESAWEGSNPDWLGSGVEMHWHIAGHETTRSHLRTAGFTLVDEWFVGDDLAADDAAFPFLLARLDG